MLFLLVVSPFRHVGQAERCNLHVHMRSPSVLVLVNVEKGSDAARRVQTDLIVSFFLKDFVFVLGWPWFFDTSERQSAASCMYAYATLLPLFFSMWERPVTLHGVCKRIFFKPQVCHKFFSSHKCADSLKYRRMTTQSHKEGGQNQNHAKATDHRVARNFQVAVRTCWREMVS